jgi:cytochrome c biogenesis protein
MAQITVANGTPSRSPVEIMIDRIWRFFTSVRMAVLEITLLAVLVLIGTLRGSDAPQWMANAAPALQPLVDRWYAWDVFGSPIFAILLAVISVAIAVCTVNRLPAIWGTINAPRIRTSKGYIERAEVNASFTQAGTLDELRQGMESIFKARRYRFFTEQVGNDLHFYADKNRWAKLGTFPFHLALILLLVGGIVASVYGFRDTNFAVAEGQTQNVGHGTGLSVELVRFTDDYTQEGIASNYESQVVIYDNGRPAEEGSITVNSPLSHGVATFYQGGFGISVDMRIAGVSGNTLYDESLEMGFYNFRNNPDAPAGLIRLPSEGVQVAVVAPDTDRANRPDLDTLQLQSGQVWVQVSPLSTSDSSMEPVTAVLDQGAPLEVGDLTLLFERESRFTVLQVAYNPGIPIFFIASVLLVGGLATTFYFPLRRVRGIIHQGASGNTLTMTPLAKRDWGGKKEFFGMAERAGEHFHTTPTIKRPDNEGNWHDDASHEPDDDETR